jgi:hypothetical protein
MKQFRTLAIVKHPRELVWLTIRDHMVELVPRLQDVAAVLTRKRDERADGTVELVNLWQARAQVPSALASVVRPEMLAWTDEAEWHASTWQCRWRVRPVFLAGVVACSGSTSFEPAVGGRGTRLVFEGTLDLSQASLPGVPGVLAGATLSAVETFAAGLIPRNFLKLAQAADQHLDGSVRPPAPSDSSQD